MLHILTKINSYYSYKQLIVGLQVISFFGSYLSKVHKILVGLATFTINSDALSLRCPYFCHVLSPIARTR